MAGLGRGQPATASPPQKSERPGWRTPGAAQAADCLSPGPSSNLNGCPFQGSDFAGDDLSGSSMVGTNFTNADLAGTDLSSSNMKNASFRGADLTCADLSSSGGCGTVLTNGRTFLCGTTWCDGSVRNDACPGGFPEGVCCRDADCPGGQVCDDNRCACPDGEVELANGSCGRACGIGNLCPGGCTCSQTQSVGNICEQGPKLGDCSGPQTCPAGQVCTLFGLAPARFDCRALC